MKLIGKLEGDKFHIGGETTGWQLEVQDASPEAEHMKNQKLDVRTEELRLSFYKGRKVSVSGRLEKKLWKGRGEQPLFTVLSIELA